MHSPEPNQHSLDPYLCGGSTSGHHNSHVSLSFMIFDLDYKNDIVSCQPKQAYLEFA